MRFPSNVVAGGSQEDDFAERQLAASIQRAVSALPPKFRVAILLRYFEDLSYEEMAKALNCSIGTVASRLSRGHRMLAGRAHAAQTVGKKVIMFDTHIRDQLTAYVDDEMTHRLAPAPMLTLRVAAIAVTKSSVFAAWQRFWNRCLW